MRVLRRPRGFGVAGVCLGPLSFGAASFGAVVLGAAAFDAAFLGAAFVVLVAAFSPVLASAITIPSHRSHRDQTPGPVLVPAAPYRCVQFPDARCGAGGCCSAGRSPSGSAG